MGTQVDGIGRRDAFPCSEGDPLVLAVNPLIDTPREEAFDRISRLASRILGAPIAMVSVVDGRRHFFKSSFGMPEDLLNATEVPLGHSYCQHVFASREPLVVGDTTTHPSTAGNPCNDVYGIRAYLGAPVLDEHGNVVCTVCVLDRRERLWTPLEKETMSDLVGIVEDEISLRREIDERRRMDERNALLVREMEHRVKNSMSTVQSLVGLSLRGLPGGDEVKREIHERVASMSKTHSLLVGSRWSGVSVGDLLDAEIGHYRGEVCFVERGRGIALGSHDAVTIGMIVHELATNAAKYGAISRKGGVDLSFDLDGDLLRLHWQESGCPGTVEPATTGFGTMLVDNLVRQNRGTSVRSWGEDGLSVALSIRLVQEESSR